ncbi:hypothetical protein HY214_04435 [Candidatus Roizmanbacteria bacterium]|nr:hypothetical protein [Candidatus Roizmanbacteria bacterium]
MKTMLLIDAYAIIHRAFYAMPSFSTKDGTPTNAVYGFLTMLVKSIQDYQPDYIIVCFDTPKPTFRKKLFPQYQTQRPKTDDQLKIQVPLIRTLLDKGGIARAEKEGYEADDVIGTLAAKYKNQMRILILTGDKDMFQLVDQNVYIITPKVGLSTVVMYDRSGVIEKLGVPPEQIPDYKALVGDQSDNYKGAKGIGPKTAIKLLNDYQTSEKIVQNAAAIKNEKVRHLIESNRAEIELSKKLATIITDIPFDMSLADCSFSAFKPGLKDFLIDLQFNSLTKRIFPPKATGPVSKSDGKKEKHQLDLFS